MGWLEDKYGGGETEVYYLNDPDCTFLLNREACLEKVDVNNLDKTHIKVGDVPFADPEEVFMKMQGEMWSPRGEARADIRAKGLKHTSMSMGDIVCLPDGRCLITDAVGFVEVGRRK